MAKNRCPKFATRWFLPGIIAALGLILLVPGAAARSAPDVRTVRFANTGALLQPFAEVDPPAMRAAIETWGTRYMQTGSYALRWKYEVLHDVKSTLAALRTGTADVVVLSAINYVKYRQELNARPLCSPVFGGALTETYVLVVRKASGIRTLAQLAGRSLVTRRGFYGEVARMWLDTQLMSRGLAASARFFSGITDGSRASQAVLPVFFGKIDACVVPLSSLRTMMELNPQLGRDLCIVASSPPYLVGVICLRLDCDPRTRDEMRTALVNMDRNVEGRHILTLFRCDRLVPFVPASLEGVTRLVRDHRTLVNRRTHGRR